MNNSKKIRWLFLYLMLVIASITMGQNANPVANPAAVIIQGHARFTILTDMLVRMEYAVNDSFVDNASLTFVNRNLPVPSYTVKHDKGWLIIKTGHLVLRYKENSGKFTHANLEINYLELETTESKVGFIRVIEMVKKYTWKPGTKDHQNLKGTTRTLDAASGKFSFQSLKKLDIEDGIISKSGWAFMDDSERPLFDNSDWPWVEARKNYKNQDWYFFGYGNNYKRALYDFVSTSGRISLPPKYAFGIWYSRYWAYTEQDLKDIVNDYEKNNIPLDVLVVDMDWHLTQKSSPEIFKRYTPKPNGWTGYTWEKKYFPDYKEFLKWTDGHQLQTCLNIHPAAGVQPHETAYPAFAKAMGVDTTNHPTIPFNITDKKFAQNYFDILLHPYEKDGIDFWWLDWQQWGGTNIKGVNPTFYLNYVHYSDMQQQGKRPLIFHRYGGLGNQRYQIGFSGDCIIDWKSLKYQPEFTATAANVGFGYWSHDIGGHTNPISKAAKHDPELFTRWVQWGAFSPIFRTHATKDAEIERRIWKYPEANFKAMRAAMQQRYALLPYIYTYARMAYDSGVSLVHPMYYEYPLAPEAYNNPQQYFFGNDIIVAPVQQSMKGKDKVQQKIWLPAGLWYDYRNGETIAGGKVFEAYYKLEEIPVFVKAGSIVPTQPLKHRITGSVTDTLILTVYPAQFNYSRSQITAAPFTGQKANFTLYEDDGTTEKYKQNICSYTHFLYQQTLDTAIFTIEPDGKTYTGQTDERSYSINILNTTKPSHLNINKKTGEENKDWDFDEATHTLNIHIARQKIGKIEIDFN